MDNDSASVPTRVRSVDAFRGFVMFLMMAEVLHLARLAAHFPGSAFWAAVRDHTSHVEWKGCSLHDLIQPSFSFLVGVSLPFSIAQREGKGQSRWRMLAHAAWRSVLLIVLGIFLRSIGRPQTNFTFTDTLGQIGLGYVFLFLLGLCRPRVQWGAFVLIVVGYWALFAFQAPARTNLFYEAGLNGEENTRLLPWKKNANPAAEFDRWFLNQFPRDKKFEFEPGGYATLSFIPTLATMILGLLAGGWLRKPWLPGRKVVLFLAVGLAGMSLGTGLEYFGICPIVKRIWTPAWVLYSGGWAFLLLAGFYLVIDLIGFWRWSFPFLVLGANSIVAYCSTALCRGFILDSLKTHGNTVNRTFDTDLFKLLGPEWEITLTGAVVLLILWLMLFWMYRNKIFVRI